MPSPQDDKSRSLARNGSLNARAKRVTDELFKDAEFFDPRDLVQVKYEMLRRVRVDGHPVIRAAQAFGLSRPAFYLAKDAFDRAGLPGLVPRRPGPRGAHKLSETVMGFINEVLANDSTLRAPALAERVLQRFGLSIHPRSIERALARGQKGGR